MDDYRRRTATILHVEDSPDDALLVDRAFRRADLPDRIRRVFDGEEAVRYLAGGGVYADREAHPLPALVLLDLKLPRSSGFEVLQWLRDQDRLRRIPVVVLSSSREPQDIERALELGANAYLLKPVSFRRLVVMVTRLHGFWMEWNEFPPS